MAEGVRRQSCDAHLCMHRDQVELLIGVSGDVTIAPGRKVFANNIDGKAKCKIDC